MFLDIYYFILSCPLTYQSINVITRGDKKSPVEGEGGSHIRFFITNRNPLATGLDFGHDEVITFQLEPISSNHLDILGRSFESHPQRTVCVVGTIDAEYYCREEK